MYLRESFKVRIITEELHALVQSAYYKEEGSTFENASQASLQTKKFIFVKVANSLYCRISSKKDLGRFELFYGLDGALYQGGCLLKDGIF